MLDISCPHAIMLASHFSTAYMHVLATHLLLLVANNGTDNSVFLPCQAVTSALNIAFRHRCVVLCFAGGMFFLPGLLPRLGTCQIANLYRIEVRSVLNLGCKYAYSLYYSALHEWYWPVILL